MDLQTLLRRIFGSNKAPGINSGASRDFITVNKYGMVVINFLDDEKLVKIATDIKLSELLALTGNQIISGQENITAVVFDDIIKGIGIYFDYGETESNLIIVSREDLAKL